MGWGGVGWERSSGNWLWAGSSCSPCPCSRQLSRLRQRDGPWCHTGRGSELGFFGIKEKQHFGSCFSSQPALLSCQDGSVPKGKAGNFSHSGQSQLE